MKIANDHLSAEFAKPIDEWRTDRAVDEAYFVGIRGRGISKERKQLEDSIVNEFDKESKLI